MLKILDGVSMEKINKTDQLVETKIAQELKEIYKNKYGTFGVNINTDGEKTFKNFKTLDEAKEYAERTRKEQHRQFARN